MQLSAIFFAAGRAWWRLRDGDVIFFYNGHIKTRFLLRSKKVQKSQSLEGRTLRSEGMENKA
ncbi:hypothetical protein DAI22_10g063500 [Oryza sativa Japonica Group]|nr:hypothetical protein DAI22_10g063500 [Oryza sativa Japonica Group]